MSELTIELTDSERSKVNSSRVTEDSDLPRVYSISSSSSTPISRDMEAFLILEDFKFKDTMTDVIKASLDSSQDDLEAELFDEAIKNEQDIVANELADCNSKLGTTTSVKEGLKSAKFLKFTNVSDISDLFSAVSSSQNSLTIKKRLATFKFSYLKSLKSTFTPGTDYSSQYKKQLESWLSPLTKY